MDEFTRIDAPPAAPPARDPTRPAMARPDPRKAEFEANKLRKRLRRQVGEADRRLRADRTATTG